MRYSKLIVLALSTAIVVVGGCSSDDDDSPSGGKSGKGGTAGKGNGGKGGSGGAKAGNGGKGGVAADGGKGASGGKGGVAGKGVGGKSGAGGKGGNGGDAGACIEEVAAHPLGNSCGNAEEATVSTECTFVDTCKALGCGKPFSDFDASGCRRPTCDSSDGCDNGERCVPAVLHGETGCYSSVYENCNVSDCNTCGCVASDSA